MHRGFTKRWRKRWDKGYHLDSDLWLLMDYFIDFANYKDSEVYVKKCGLIPLKRGQHIFGTRQLSGFLGWPRGLVRRKLLILETIGFLTLKTTHMYSIATVINYDTYQPSDWHSASKRPAERPAKRPTTGPLNDPQPATPKEYKKEKKVKNKEAETFSLPSTEELNESSIKKLRSDIKTVSRKIYDKKIFLKIYAFINTNLKKNKNERAILHSLARCYIKGINEPFKDDSSAWAYCTKILQIENGNYNERDYQKTA